MNLTLLDIIIFFFGIFLLYYCSNLLIDNGSVLARKYNISKMMIGMTLIALGTSLPELIVSVLASFQGKIDLVIGNILGSNIANIGLVTGLSAIFYKISCNFKKIKLDIGFLAVSSVLFTFILYFKKFENLYAVILLAVLFIYIYILIKSDRIIDIDNKQESYSDSTEKLIFFILIGSVGLSLGSYCLIEGAVAIAEYFNISQMVIGATAVALGTSLPELATSFNAAKRNEFQLLLGNIFGSNIINIVLAFGTSLLINNNIPKTKDYNFDLIVFLFLTIVLILSLINGKIYRFIGLLLLSVYTYYVFLIL